MNRRQFIGVSAAGLGCTGLGPGLYADQDGQPESEKGVPKRGLRVLPIGYQVWGLAFSPKEPILATCGCIRGDITPSRLRELQKQNRVPKGPTALVLWNMQTLKAQKTLDGGSECWSVEFSMDGKRVAAGRAGRGVRIWDVASGDEIATLADRQETGDVHHRTIGFMQKDQWLVSSSTESVRVWDVQSESLMHRLDYRQATTVVAIPPIGDYLVSGGLGGNSRFG
jgi:WD40 repeat protein